MAENGNRCVYIVSVKTGTEKDAGTDAVVSLTLSNQNNERIEIPNLEKWGLMEPGHAYFENGNLDIFAVPGKTLDPPVCSMKLSHDNTGTGPGWYVSYVEIRTVANDISSPERFSLHQWLAVSPYSLSVTKSNCPT